MVLAGGPRAAGGYGSGGGGGLSEGAVGQLIRDAAPALNILDYGGAGDDSTDNSAAFAAAMADLPAGQGMIVFPPDAANTYRLGGLTIDRPDVVIRAPGVILKKNANGPVFTVQNGVGLALGAVFEYVTIDGNGATFTGPGISWVHGGRSKMIGCRIFDTASYCMDFAVDAGSRFLCNTSTFARYLGGIGETNDGAEAIHLPADVGSVGREFFGCSADCKFLSDGGSENTHLIGGFHLGFTFTGRAKKMVIQGQRITAINQPLELHVVSGAVVGNALACENGNGDVNVIGTSALTAFSGNTVYGGVRFDADTFSDFPNRWDASNTVDPRPIIDEAGTNKINIGQRYAQDTKTTNTTLNSTTWIDVDAALEVSIAAVAGEILTSGFTCQMDNGAVNAFFDIGIYKNGSLVRQVGQDGASGEGITGWMVNSGAYSSVQHSFPFQVQIGDVHTDGTVTLRIRFRGSSATNRVLYAGATRPLIHWVRAG